MIDEFRNYETSSASELKIESVFDICNFDIPASVQTFEPKIDLWNEKSSTHWNWRQKYVVYNSRDFSTFGTYRRIEPDQQKMNRENKSFLR